MCARGKVVGRSVEPQLDVVPGRGPATAVVRAAVVLEDDESSGVVGDLVVLCADAAFVLVVEAVVAVVAVDPIVAAMRLVAGAPAGSNRGCVHTPRVVISVPPLHIHSTCANAD